MKKESSEPTIGRRLRGRRKASNSAATQDQQSPKFQGNGAGIIRPKTSELRLPANFDELGAEQSSRHSIKIIFVIAAIALTFILIIAYFVSQMPDKS